MILGIDASNLRSGGGVTHLVQLLLAGNPREYGFTQVVLWGGRSTLNQVEDRSWLVKCHLPLLDRHLLRRILWQRFALSALARQAGCDVLFVPGGSFAGDFGPTVTMSRNLLPFQWSELKRFGWSWMAAKLLLLRFVQARSLERATGVIFLTRYAREVVMGALRNISGVSAVIPHGLDGRFLRKPSEPLPIEQYTADQPFRILYVSTIDVYKHQDNVVEAVAALRASGMSVRLDMVGRAYRPALERLKRTMDRVDREGRFICYSGEVSYADLPGKYHQSDLCVFASSCENMPNILLEGMGSGLPIACSDRGPMQEILGDAGVYFDPERPQDIARSLKTLIESPQLRLQKARASFRAAQEYSWPRCASETYQFLATFAIGTGFTEAERQNDV